MRASEALTGLAALLRRDLAAGRRGVATLVVRSLVIGLTAAVALFALHRSELLYRQPEAAGLFGWSVSWVLLLLSTLLLPYLALQALRHERESGRLDLLLLAGLSPRLLAIGRWLSAFLLLESLLLDALPAMAAFAFFATPSPALLAWAALALTAWNALLAGLAVLISAAVPRVGTCVAAGLVVVIALAWACGWALADDKRARFTTLHAPVAPAALAALTSQSVSPNPLPLRPASQLATAATLIAAGGLLALAAGRRLARAPRTAPSGRAGGATGRRRRLRDLGRPGPVGAEPLGWLLQRNAPFLRPLALAALLPAAWLALGLVFELRSWMRPGEEGFERLVTADGLVAGAACAWAVGLLLTALGGALQVARSRERNEWDSLLASSRSGRSLVLGLLQGPFEAALTIALFVLGLAAALELVAPWQADQDLPYWVAVLLGLAGTCGLALVLGLAAGLAARTQAGAMGLCLLLVLTAAAEGVLVATWLDGTDLGVGFDAMSRASAVALAVVLVMPLQFLLLDRLRRRPGPGRLFFDLSCGALLVAPPLVNAMMDTHGSRHHVHAPLLGLACATLAVPLLAVLLRRSDAWLGRTG